MTNKPKYNQKGYFYTIKVLNYDRLLIMKLK